MISTNGRITRHRNKAFVEVPVSALVEFGSERTVHVTLGDELSGEPLYQVLVNRYKHTGLFY